MIKIQAKLKLYSVRTTPFCDGYRPAFKFIDKTFTSGSISLKNDRKYFYPGETDDVEISFLFKEFIGEKLNIGEIIFFYEGSILVGEIEILEILSEE